MRQCRFSCDYDYFSYNERVNDLELERQTNRNRIKKKKKRNERKHVYFHHDEIPLEERN